MGINTDSGYREFSFVDDRDGARLRVLIPEEPQASYGTYLWPCAPVLSQYIWYNRDALRGQNVLELGAGTSLPGIVAAKCGAVVILSDAAGMPECLEQCRKSCEANFVAEVQVVGLTWGEFSPALINLAPMDIVLGSDCFYDSADFEKIVATVAFLMSKNPKAVFWTTYQIRSTGASAALSYLLARWGLRCATVPLDSFTSIVQTGGACERGPAHDILLLEITAADI